LVVLGLKIKFQGYRVSSVFLFFAALLQILLFIPPSFHYNALPLLNIRLFAWLMFFITSTVAAYLYRRHQLAIGETERSLFSLFAFFAAFSGLAGLSFEIHDFFAAIGIPLFGQSVV